MSNDFESTIERMKLIEEVKKLGFEASREFLEYANTHEGTPEELLKAFLDLKK